MRKILNPDFFKRDSHVVARDLLGKYLVRKVGNEEIARMIVEVEAYGGQEDLASHARFGETARNKVMFGQAGVFYVYFIYGMYWMLNVVCRKGGEPGAVLIRVLEGFGGPGKLTRDLKIGKSFTGKIATPKSGLWFEDKGVEVGGQDIRVARRVGVAYAGEWKDKLWNFSILQSKS